MLLQGLEKFDFRNRLIDGANESSSSFPTENEQFNVKHNKRTASKLPSSHFCIFRAIRSCGLVNLYIKIQLLPRNSLSKESSPVLFSLAAGH